jgi:hypothetical protein
MHVFSEHFNNSCKNDLTDHLPSSVVLFWKGVKNIGNCIYEGITSKALCKLSPVLCAWMPPVPLYSLNTELRIRCNMKRSKSNIKQAVQCNSY